MPIGSSQRGAAICTTAKLSLERARGTSGRDNGLMRPLGPFPHIPQRRNKPGTFLWKIKPRKVDRVVQEIDGLAKILIGDGTHYYRESHRPARGNRAGAGRRVAGPRRGRLGPSWIRARDRASLWLKSLPQHSLRVRAPLASGSPLAMSDFFLPLRRRVRPQLGIHHGLHCFSDYHRP